jgi:hypothetical protein
MKYFCNAFLLCFISQAGFSQEKSNFKDGYALKGKDTIRCKVQFNSNHTHPWKTVTLLINNEESTFFAGGTITGFGVEEDGKKYEYGTVDAEVSVGPTRAVNTLFIKKLSAGAIDLYEHEYAITTTRRKTINGEAQPGSTTSSQNFTKYYIAKTDSARPVLARPVLLPSFRKKDLEIYLGDNAVLFAREEKRYSLKELIAVINEYNNWYTEKQKTP